VYSGSGSYNPATGTVIVQAVNLQWNEAREKWGSPSFCQGRWDSERSFVYCRSQDWRSERSTNSWPEHDMSAGLSRVPSASTAFWVSLGSSN